MIVKTMFNDFCQSVTCQIRSVRSISFPGVLNVRRTGTQLQKLMRQSGVITRSQDLIKIYIFSPVSRHIPILKNITAVIIAQPYAFFKSCAKYHGILSDKRADVFIGK